MNGFNCMKYVLYSSDYVTKILEKKGFNFEYRITVDANEINNDVKRAKCRGFFCILRFEK